MIYFSNTTNQNLLIKKVNEDKIIRIFQGIYIEKEDLQNIKLYIEDILNYLNIEGIIYFKSSIETLNNKIEDNILYIASKTINKTLELKVNNKLIFTIKVLKTNSILFDKSIYIEKQINKLKYLNFETSFVLNFLESNVFSKRSNKELSFFLLKKYIIKKYGSIENKNIFFLNIKNILNNENINEKNINLENIKNNFETFLISNKKYETIYVDEERMELFNKCKEVLQFLEIEHKFEEKLEINNYMYKNNNNYNSIINANFFESYFSNYIEGTEFEIDEATKIIFNKEHIYQRHSDGHDIKNTFNILNTLSNNYVEYNSFEEFFTFIKNIHVEMLSHRKDNINVGEIKKIKNKAGNTTFVAPSFVYDTLKEGFKIYKELQNEGLMYSSAIFLKLLFLEVHPFDDGNGRISRILLNNELFKISKNNMFKIIIPTVFREDYITSIKAFSNGNPKPFINTIIKALNITQSIDFNKNIEDIILNIEENSGFEKDTSLIWGIKNHNIKKIKKYI
jgi:Fic family protein